MIAGLILAVWLVAVQDRPADPSAEFAAARSLYATAAYEDALTSAGRPGTSRIWFVSYLRAILVEYGRLKARIGVRGIKLLLPGRRRSRLAQLIRGSSKRDRRTVSRWAGTLSHALRDNISPASFADWLKKGGGVSGRCRLKRSRPIGASSDGWED